MAFKFTVGSRVRIIDESSEFKGNRITPKSGTVLSRTDAATDPTNQYRVRPDGHGTGQSRVFLERQLRTEPLASEIDYTN